MRGLWEKLRLAGSDLEDARSEISDSESTTASFASQECWEDSSQSSPTRTRTLRCESWADITDEDLGSAYDSADSSPTLRPLSGPPGVLLPPLPAQDWTPLGVFLAPAALPVPAGLGVHRAEPAVQLGPPGVLTAQPVSLPEGPPGVLELPVALSCPPGVLSAQLPFTGPPGVFISP